MTDDLPQTRRCSKCKLDKPIAEFSPDKRRSSGHVGQCKACRRKYNKKYYDANAEQLIQAELARRGASERPTGPRIKSMTISVKFDPADMRQVKAAYIKEYGLEPTDVQLREWLMRYALAGVRGQAKYILEKRPGN